MNISDLDCNELRKIILHNTRRGTVAAEALSMALKKIQESSEIHQYCKIGTIDECREAVEKQRAKKPELYGDFEDGKLLCPNCQEDLIDLRDCGFNACPYCGQALDRGGN